MTKPILNEDLLRRYFVNDDKRSYGMISDREKKASYFNMSDDLAEALNSKECLGQQISEQPVCIARMNSKEVDQYLKKHPDEGLLNLFKLQDLELEVGAPLFTPEAEKVIKKKFARKISDIYGNPDITDLTREVIYDHEFKKKAYVARFNYLGQPMELTNGGFRFNSQMWDPYMGEHGAMEDVEILFYHSDFWVMGNGGQLIEDPMVHTRFISVLEQSQQAKEAIQKIYDLGTYQLEVSKPSADPNGEPVDSPIMVLNFSKTEVLVDAYRFESQESPRVIKVQLKIDLTRLNQDDFYSEVKPKKKD